LRLVTTYYTYPEPTPISTALVFPQPVTPMNSPTVSWTQIYGRLRNWMPAAADALPLEQTGKKCSTMTPDVPLV
jgi:hypothetical protein